MIKEEWHNISPFSVGDHNDLDDFCGCKTLRTPIFFIVGGPRSGTSALYTYLRGHPNIFMPEFKEPHYFATDLYKRKRVVSSLNKYLELFKGAGEEHYAVGEASVYYLYSREAIRNILDFAPDAKFIAMIRNPIDVAHSLHGKFLYLMYEKEKDFRKAWNRDYDGWHSCDTRKGDQNLATMNYCGVAMLGEQIERLLASVPREQAKVVIFDDFVEDTLAVYKDILSFLGVDFDGREEFPRINEYKTHRSRFLARFVFGRARVIPAIAGFLKKAFGISKTGIVTAMLGSRSVRREALSAEFRQELIEAVRDDVVKLSTCVGRDLNHWLK